MADTPIGKPDSFVDTQGFKLLVKDVDPSDDTQSFTQVLSLVPAKIQHSVDFNQLTNDTVDKVFGLTDASFEVKLMLTQQEIAFLLSLSLPTDAQLEVREWTIQITDVSKRTTDIVGDAAMSKFDIIDPGVGLATAEFTLDFVSGATVSGASAKVLS